MKRPQIVKIKGFQQKAQHATCYPARHIINLISTLESETCSVVSNSLWPDRLNSPWNSPGQNTGVGSVFLLQGFFPSQGLNPGLPHCRQLLYQLSHKESPRILEWIAYPFFSRSSQPMNQTRVSCTAGRFFTNGAIREALNIFIDLYSSWNAPS